jgi:hypothetical protein
MANASSTLLEDSPINLNCKSRIVPVCLLDSNEGKHQMIRVVQKEGATRLK